LFSQERICVENADGIKLYYAISLDNKRLTLVSPNDGYYSGDIVIPDEVTYLHYTRKVTGISMECFKNCSELTSVTFPCYLEKIGGNAFNNCTALKSISIPIGIIGGRAFQNCTGLTDVVIGDGVTEIEDYAFCRCTNLENVNFGNNVSRIGKYCFYECNKLSSVTLNNCIIDENAFWECKGITHVCIGKGENSNPIGSIGKQAFSN
jgi:hypothetical protein